MVACAPHASGSLKIQNVLLVQGDLFDTGPIKLEFCFK